MNEKRPGRQSSRPGLHGFATALHGSRLEKGSAHRIKPGNVLLLITLCNGLACLCAEIQIVDVACMTGLGSASRFLAHLFAGLGASGELGILAIVLALNDVTLRIGLRQIRVLRMMKPLPSGSGFFSSAIERGTDLRPAAQFGSG